MDRHRNAQERPNGEHCNSTLEAVRGAFVSPLRSTGKACRRGWHKKLILPHLVEIMMYHSIAERTERERRYNWVSK